MKALRESTRPPLPLRPTWLRRRRTKRDSGKLRSYKR